MKEWFAGCGFSPADILLPRKCDMTKWSVVACDQYTSQPEYWREVENFVGDAPSTLRLMLPEAYLGSSGETERIGDIRRAMADYLARGVFRKLGDSLVFVERTLPGGRVRRGLVGALDLKDYDFRLGAGTLVRATEGTVLARIPPRMKVRQGAPLEMPHVMVLLDDPEDAVIGSAARLAENRPLYDFDLMQGSGHLRGRRVSGETLLPVARALRRLVSEEEFERRYHMPGRPVLGYAVGDGNHSLATARRCYEKVRERLSPAEALRHPARYALVELVNLHDPALRFRPIHRLLTGVAAQAVVCEFLRTVPGARLGEGPGHRLEYVWAGGAGVLTCERPEVPLTVALLQKFIDRYLPRAGAGAGVDYIHGEEAARRLGSQPGALAFLLPPMDKAGLFPEVIRNGALPRKTFSMGEAAEKRFYLECRRIERA